MGQAKARREALRAKSLRMSERWDFEPSPWEAAICAELVAATAQVARCVPKDQLALARMSANDCHANTRWYADNDPSQTTRAVTGWWVQWPNFVLHSVIERPDGLICITPSPLNEVQFPFIPDPKIIWIKDGDVYSAIRDGQKIGVGVRMFPEFTMAQNAIVRKRMLSGVDPFEAARFTDEEMTELKRKHIKDTGR